MKPEEYYAMHQKAFRCAFDFLNQHFPPGDTPEWWLQTTQEITDASVKQGENELVVGLLRGVFDYLDTEYKRRRDEPCSK